MRFWRTLLMGADHRNRLRGKNSPAMPFVLCVAFLFATPSLASAQDSGKQDFTKHCVGCHGADGRGHGPDLYILAGVKPADLTVLSKKNGGVFPFQDVEDTIDGRKKVPKHNRFDMPFWGVTFQQSGKEFTPESEAKAKERIDNVIRYIETLQQQ
jgi:mono/diheme cytochrome c family protein